MKLKAMHNKRFHEVTFEAEGHGGKHKWIVATIRNLCYSWRPLWLLVFAFTGHMRLSGQLPAEAAIRSS